MDEHIFGRQMNKLGGRRDLDAFRGAVGIFSAISSLVSRGGLDSAHRTEGKC